MLTFVSTRTAICWQLSGLFPRLWLVCVFLWECSRRLKLLAARAQWLWKANTGIRSSNHERKQPSESLQLYWSKWKAVYVGMCVRSWSPLIIRYLQHPSFPLTSVSQSYYSSVLFSLCSAQITSSYTHLLTPLHPKQRLSFLNTLLLWN